MSVFLSHVREGLLNIARLCSSHCEFLCGEFGFALIPHHLRGACCGTAEAYFHILFSCGNIYLPFFLFGRQGLRAL